jgi:hypothetical protein
VPLGNGKTIVTELNSDQKSVDDFIRRITFIKTQSAVNVYHDVEEEKHEEPRVKQPQVEEEKTTGLTSDVIE